MKLKKIVSGAQTGADRAGLDAALELGIEPGGTMPFGYQALDGCHPEFKTKYSIVMHSSSSYAPRTRKNVQDSDATIRFAYDFGSAGEKCTLKAIKSLQKPYFDVDLNDPPTIAEAAAFLEENEVEVLNIAGNSESTAPGTYDKTKAYLLQLVALLRST